MKALPTVLALAALTPLPLLPAAAATSADIQASGSAAKFCNISNNGPAIAMVLSAEGDKLSGAGKYSYIANGNATVALSAIVATAPSGAAASTPTISLADLVSNSSTSASATSNASGGVIRKEGDIAAVVTQNNSARLLTEGAYVLQATATCTSL